MHSEGTSLYNDRQKCDAIEEISKNLLQNWSDSAMRSILRAYQKLLQKHPIVLQSFQTGVLMTTGDFLAQTLIEKRSFAQVDVRRTVDFFIIGSVFTGPMITFWYRFLHKQFGQKGSDTALKKMLIDQLIFAPVGLLYTLAAINFLQGKSFRELKKEVKRDYFDVLLTNYKVWPAVQLLNFYSMPLNYQVLLVQSVAVLWSMYLSWKTHKKLDGDN